MVAVSITVILYVAVVISGEITLVTQCVTCSNVTIPGMDELTFLEPNSEYRSSRGARQPNVALYAGAHTEDEYSRRTSSNFGSFIKFGLVGVGYRYNKVSSSTPRIRSPNKTPLSFRSKLVSINGTNRLQPLDTKCRNCPISVSHKANRRSKRSWFGLPEADKSTSAMSTPRSTSTTLSSFPTPTPTSMLHSAMCPQVTENAYRSQMCPYPNPEAYLEANKDQHSCEGRCGHVPEYRLVQPLCACDETCKVHGDCCADLSTECPIVSSKSVAILSRLEPKSSTCEFTPYRVVSICKTSTTGSFAGSPPISFDDFFDTFSDHGYNVKRILSTDKRFNVADVGLGVIFDDYSTYLRCTGTPQRPNFVPKEIIFACPKPKFLSESSLSWFTTSSNCRRLGFGLVITSLHRSCRSDFMVSCQCSYGIEHDSLHNVCLGPGQRMWQYKVHPSLDIVVPELNNDCKLTNFSESVKSRRIDQIRSGELEVRVRVTPSVSSQTNYGETKRLETKHVRESDAQSDENLAPGGEKFNVFDRNVINKRPIINMMNDSDNNHSFLYDIEFDQALETRIRCPSIESELNDCVPLECSAQGVLAINYTGLRDEDDSQRIPWSQLPCEIESKRCLSCVVPFKITVKGVSRGEEITFCTCMTILMALRRLRRPWIVMRRGVTSAECVMLVTVEQKTDNSIQVEPEMYTFPDRPQASTEEFASGRQWFDLNQDLAEELKSQYLETSLICKTVMKFEEIIVCLHSSPSTTSGEIWRACLESSSRFKNTRTNAGSALRVLSNLVILVVYFLGCEFSLL